MPPADADGHQPHYRSLGGRITFRSRIIPARRTLSRPARIALVATAGVALFLVALAAVPWQLLRGIAQDRLSARIGAPVTIAGASRGAWLSFHPVVTLEDVRIAQPAWAGRGDLARIERIAIRFATLPVLLGKLRIEMVQLDGARIRLVRDAQGRWNTQGRGGRKEGDDGGFAIADVTVRRSVLSIEDRKRHMAFAGPLAADARGIALDGRGTHRGRPLTVRLRAGPAIADTPWPVAVDLRSPTLTFRAQARTAKPLSIDRLTGRIEASADDLHRLDDVIEAGLPGTQAVRLTAQVRHEKPDWHVSHLAGTIGRSPIRGDLDVTRRDGRTRLDGALTFARLDFDDLASDAQQTAAAARTRATGPRILPTTPIHFEKLGKTDGRLRLVARRLVSPRPGMFRSLSATLAMDRRRLTVSDLVVALPHGRLTGGVTVDHRGDVPRMTVDLRVAGARLDDLLATDMVSAPLAAHIRMTGTGRTVRAAMERGSGTIGLAGRGGSLAKPLAVVMSGDVLASVGQLVDRDDGERVPVRCVIARFTATGGRITPRELLFDSPVARADGRGTINLTGETLDLAFTGRAHDPGMIQSTAPIRLVGTLSRPKVEVLPQSLRNKGLFKKIGAFVKGLRTGDDRPVAPAVDCARLAAAALR